MVVVVIQKTVYAENAKAIQGDTIRIANELEYEVIIMIRVLIAGSFFHVPFREDTKF
jgi:hypothetical protein